MNCRTLCWTSILMLRSIPGVVYAGAEPPDPALPTNFAVLVGYPQSLTESGSQVSLAPGTVIPLVDDAKLFDDSKNRQVIERSLSMAKAMEKLWATFRLDPARQLQSGKYAALEKEVLVEIPTPPETGIRISVTLTHLQPDQAVYRVLIQQDGRILAQSTPAVTRGGRAVVGAVNGPAAPYLFLFIEPDAPGERLMGPASGSKSANFTPPVAVRKVPPIYPEEAKKSKISGEVVLDLAIDAQGKLIDVRAIQYPDIRLADAAIAAARQWEFQPARQEDGQPMSVRLAITFKFKLQ